MGARKLAGSALPLGLLAALVWLWLANCRGPEVEVRATEIEPPSQPGQPYVVRAVIRNQGPGTGQARVSFHLTSNDGRRVYAEEKQVQLAKHETVTVEAEVSAPPGDYHLEVDATYPP